MYYFYQVKLLTVFLFLIDVSLIYNVVLITAAATAAAAKSLQLCPTLCDPIDSSPPGSPVPGILQARTLEWVAISFSNAWKWKVKVKSLSRVRLLATPWTAAYHAPPSIGFSRQEYWSGVPLPSPVLITAVWQSDSVIHIHTFFFMFFSIMIYYRILNIVHCALQSDLVIYTFYIYYFASAKCKFPTHLSPTSPPPPWQPQVCSQSSFILLGHWRKPGIDWHGERIYGWEKQKQFLGQKSPPNSRGDYLAGWSSGVI